MAVRGCGVHRVPQCDIASVCTMGGVGDRKRAMSTWGDRWHGPCSVVHRKPNERMPYKPVDGFTPIGEGGSGGL